jgi:putative oxidoreductase
MASLAARLDPARPLALLALRIGVGITMAWHGWQKFEGGVSNFAGFVDSVGLPAPTLLAWTVSILELVGGLMIVGGLLTRLPAFLIALQMIGTAFYVKASQLSTGFIAAEGVGFELDVVLLVGAFAIAVLGPGAFSLDHALGWEPSTAPARTDAAVGRQRPAPA